MLEKILRWTVIAGIFALPFIIFIVANSLFFPYITGKNFAFRIIVEIIAVAWLALALTKPEYRPRKSWLLGAFAAFVVIIAAADAFGVHPFKSFWSNYERMDGWVTLAHLFAYFVVASSILSTQKLWRWLWLTLLWVSILVGLYGVLQFMGVAALGQRGAGGLGGRLDATFGNPIYLAVFMLFNIFIAAFLWSENWRESPTRKRGSVFAWGIGVLLLDMYLLYSLGPSLAVFLVIALLDVFTAAFVWAGVWGERPAGGRLAVSSWYGGIIAFDTIILLLTGTRGTTLGLIGGTLLALVLYAFFAPMPGAMRARKIAVGAIAAIAVLGGSLWLARDTAFVHSVGFLDRLASISLEDNTTKARFMNWGMAWEGVKERPLLGWGQENYAIVFDKYYNPKMYAQEQWFDRVHNVVFDWLVAGGFLGFISYIMLYACALWCVWKGSANSGIAARDDRRREQKNGAGDAGAFSLVERSILTGLLAGYFFHNLFVFDNVSSYILFATVLAYIASRAAAAQNLPTLFPSGGISSSAMPVIAIVSVVLVFGTAWWVNGRAFAQNRALLQAISPQMSINVFEIGAKNFWPNDPEPHVALAAAYYATGNPSEAIAQLQEAGKLADSGVAGNSLKGESDTLIQEVTKIGIGGGVPEHVKYFENAVQNLKKKAVDARPGVIEQLRKAEQAQRIASPDRTEEIKKQVSDLAYVISVLDALAGGASGDLIMEVRDERPRGLLRNLEYYKESVGYGSYGIQEAREQLTQVTAQMAGAEQVSSDVKEKFRQVSESEMTLQTKASPLDARFPLFLGIVYKAYGDLENAAKSFKLAHDLSPGKQAILFEMGANAQSLGRNEEALQYFKEAFELAPEFTSARIYYASALIRYGQEQLADEILVPIVRTGSAADPNIASAYTSRGRYDKIVEIWSAKVKAVPTDVQARFTLSAALVGMGQPEQAIAEIEKVKAIDSSATAQVDDFIRQVKSEKTNN